MNDFSLGEVIAPIVAFGDLQAAKVNKTLVEYWISMFVPISGFKRILTVFSRKRTPPDGIRMEQTVRIDNPRDHREPSVDPQQRHKSYNNGYTNCFETCRPPCWGWSMKGNISFLPTWAKLYEGHLEDVYQCSLRYNSAATSILYEPIRGFKFIRPIVCCVENSILWVSIYLYIPNYLHIQLSFEYILQWSCV